MDIDNGTYHGILPAVCTKGKHKVVLPSCRWPYGAQLAQTGGHAETARNAKDESVQKGDGSARW